MKPADAKLQRWIDLLAALLSHRYGKTLDDLKTIVPGYGGDKAPATVDRMFERDKDELRALGIPIRVREEDIDEGQAQRYYVKPREMYLPYLALASRSAGGSAPRAIPPSGYRDVPTLVFEPDELSALIGAARRAKSIGEPGLARDAESAIQKLTHDLGLALGSVAGESEADAARVPEPGAAPTVRVVGEAMIRRKRVSFVYYSMNRDATEERSVEAYGLAFSNGHWYLTGRDVAADALRKFRVSRMSRVAVNEKKPQSPDYEIPAGFDLASHMHARGPWELGDEEPEEMVVEIRGESGAARAVLSLGVAVPGEHARRRFHVRRADSFARWLMSFAGDVVPVSPPHLCSQYRAVVAATLASYDRPDA